MGQVRTFYDRTVELATLELDVAILARQLRTEFPDLTNYYALLVKRDWGYHLGQAVLSTKLFDK